MRAEQAIVGKNVEMAMMKGELDEQRQNGLQNHEEKKEKEATRNAESHALRQTQALRYEVQEAECAAESHRVERERQRSSDRSRLCEVEQVEATRTLRIESLARREINEMEAAAHMARRHEDSEVQRLLKKERHHEEAAMKAERARMETSEENDELRRQAHANHIKDQRNRLEVEEIESEKRRLEQQMSAVERQMRDNNGGNNLDPATKVEDCEGKCREAERKREEERIRHEEEMKDTNKSYANRMNSVEGELRKVGNELKDARRAAREEKDDVVAWRREEIN